jgi:hypothetical protein
MPEATPSQAVPNNLKCPECQALLKRRRSRSANECELLCGGCGQLFDVCSADSLDRLTQAES